MQHRPTVSRVSKVKKVRRHGSRGKTHQESNAFHHVRNQATISKLSKTFPVVENIESMPSTPYLSAGIRRQQSTNVSIIHVSRSETERVITEKYRSESQNNFPQQLNIKDLYDIQKSMNSFAAPDNITTDCKTPAIDIHSAQTSLVLRDLNLNNPTVLSTTKIGSTLSFHSNKNIYCTTSKASVFDRNSRRPHYVYRDEDNEKQRRRRRRAGCWAFCCPCCSPCCCLLTGILLALLLAGIAALIGIIITLKPKSTTTTTTTTTSSSTSATTTSTTSVTTSTSTSSTSSSTSSTSSSSTSSTSTSSTSSSSTSSSSTSSTSSSSTSSTSTSSTSTSSTSATSTSSTSTSSSSSTSTSSTSVFTTKTTTTSATTVTTTTSAATVTITSNTCTSGWKGVTVLYHCDNCPDIDPYAQYTYIYTAISNRTRIAFSFREDNGCFALDAVSVRSTLAPTIELIANNDFETGTLSSWTYCNPNNAPSAGAVIANSDNFQCMGYTYQAKSGTHFYYDGAVGNCDYLIQTFATNIGTTYTISYWLYNHGVAAASSADVIISI